ncbi:MAG: aminoacetone oxidase family FAD-binding enzyme [Syntrophotaleaceae bacterium]
MEIAIIGGGAAGFFAAIAVKENYPRASVVIFEKSRQLLAKVKISGGGRCNLTNACSSIKQLSASYPRGKRIETGVSHLRQPGCDALVRGPPGAPGGAGGRLRFPRSQDSQSVIDCFMQLTGKLHIAIELERGVESVTRAGDRLQLGFSGGQAAPRTFDKVIVATGGSPKRAGLAWLERAGHQIAEPVPSLFTFKMPDEPITELMGVVVENTQVSIQGTRFKAEGPLLITHWGMSGPAILKLSAFAARLLHEKNYHFNVQVNWSNVRNQDLVVAELQSITANHPKKFLGNFRPYALPDRLWAYLLEKSALPPDKKWADLGKGGLNRLVSLLTNDSYAVRGRTQFRDEFVTCGGVSLESIDFKTMQSKVCKNLYFAGEVMDIDGITGGFNFQAAWTTAFIAARLK